MDWSSTPFEYNHLYADAKIISNYYLNSMRQFCMLLYLVLFQTGADMKWRADWLWIFSIVPHTIHKPITINQVSPQQRLVNPLHNSYSQLETRTCNPTPLWFHNLLKVGTNSPAWNHYSRVMSQGNSLLFYTYLEHSISLNTVQGIM